MKAIKTIGDLYLSMTANNAALKSVQSVNGSETFTLVTARYSPNIKVPENIAKYFVNEYDKSLKKIALNTASTTLYVLIINI